MNRTLRQSNFELLRIVSMLMIVAHHFAVHGGFVFDASSVSTNRVWIQFLQLGGKIGVDIFVLISGYFLISASTFKISKAMRLWLQMLTYSVGIFLFAVFTGIIPFTKKALLDTFFPVSISQWWFASTYFVLFLLSPFINSFLHSVSRQMYQRFLALCLVLWCLMPTVSSMYPKFSIISPSFSSLAWFITLYSLAAYIRLWHNKVGRSSTDYFLAAAVIYIFIILTAVISDYICSSTSIFIEPTVFYDMNRLPALGASVCMFLGFKELRFGQNRFINILSSATFGVYLAHDHGITRQFLWITVFKNAAYQDSKALVPFSILTIAIVYISCTMIELIRMYLLEKHYISIVDSLSNRIRTAIDAVFDSRFAERL